MLRTLPLLSGVGLLLLSQGTPANEYHLGPGDTVSIEVYGHSEMARTTRIPASCEIDLQLIGTTEVCGLTPTALAANIRTALADGYVNNPHVVVDIEAYGSQTVDILGQVRTPGLQVLQGPTTLTDALAMAGGPSAPSVLEGTVLTHDGRKIDFYLPELHRGDPIWLSDGDVVQLREPLQVHVTGQVENPGPVAFRDGMTFSEALSLTGGPTDFAALRRAYVVSPDGSRVRLNIKRIAEGRDADIQLHSDDRIIVKQSLF